MAIFASTTTSGYSDPLKAMSIKALEQRQKEMMAQAAAGPGITPENTQTPIQGFGHVANQFADSFQQGRVAHAAAAQRQALAQTMAGMDLNNPKPHEVAAINSADPEMARQIMTQLAEYRRAQLSADTQKYGYDSSAKSAAAGHEVTRAGNQLQADTASAGQANQAAMETARLDAAKAAATEAARVAEIAQGQKDTQAKAAAAQQVLDEQVKAAALAETQRKAAEETHKTQLQTSAPEEVRWKAALDAGQMDKATYDALIKKKTSPSTAEQKFIVDQQMESVNNQSTLKTLDEALALISSPKGIHAGKGAGITTAAGQWLPDKLTGIDPETQANTQRFNTILGSQALDQLTKMKGASSDKDVDINFKIVNNPNETPENKRAALKVLKERLTYWIKVNNAAIEGAGGTAPTLGGGSAAKPEMSAEDKTQSVVNARKAIASGKWTRQQAIDKLTAAGVDTKGL